MIFVKDVDLPVISRTISTKSTLLKGKKPVTAAYRFDNP